MRRQNFLMFLATLMLAWTALPLVASAEVVQDLIICKSPGRIDEARAAASTGASVGKAVRMLRVYKTKDVATDGTTMEGCRATYSKTNVEQTVGSSRQRQQCRNIIEGIQKNLEASNWKCRSVETANTLKSKAFLTSEAMSLPPAATSGSTIQ